VTDVPEPAHSRRYGYALALIGVAGAVDAIGFLHFRSFYVSFMSGNVAATQWSGPTSINPSARSW
jgi:uncharacterized membrane protein YoaK (UPF0700 family)